MRCFVCSKTAQILELLNIIFLKKLIIEDQITIAKMYLHVLNLKTVHAQLYLFRK